jgi:myo-inositol-1(or 4)-monophosphatase
LFATGGKKYNSINEISIRKSGCAALDLAYVASGRYDGYCQSNLNLWDIAAGLIIIKEAGGVINDIDLNNHKDLNVIAASPNIYDKFIKKISNF